MKKIKTFITNLQFNNLQSKSSPDDEQGPQSNTTLTKLEENHIVNTINNQKQNSCVAIITGMERSGTTLLSKIINSHQDVFSGFECGILLDKLNNFKAVMPFADWLKHGSWQFGLPNNYLDEIKDVKYAEIYKYIFENKGSHCNKNPSNPQNLIKKSNFFIDKTPKYFESFEVIYNKVKGENIPVFIILKHFDDIFYSQCIKRNRSQKSFFISTKKVIKSLKYLKENSPINVYVFSYRNFIINKDKYISKIEEILYKCNPALLKETLSIAKFEKKIEGLTPPYPYSNWKNNKEKEKANLPTGKSAKYNALRKEFDLLLEDIKW